MTLRARNRLMPSDAMAVCALAVAPFVLHWQVTIGARAFADGDIARMYLPFGVEFARALSEGHLPFWTPLIQAGFPLFAEGHVAALYPPNHILFRVLPPYLAVSYSILVHQGWASVGMYAFARNIGLRAPSALLAAIVFGWGGFFTAHLQHVPLLATAAWLPWLALAQIRFQRAQTRSARLRWFVAAVACVALQLVSGFPQIALLNFGVYLIFAFAAPFVWQRPTPQSEREPPEVGFAMPRCDFNRLTRAVTTSALASLAALALGAGIAAAQLLPAQELLALSVRATELGAEFTTSFSLDPRALSQFLIPFAFNGAPVVTNQEYWFYLGIAPLALFIAAPLLRHDRANLILLLVSLLAFSLALGGANPIYSLVNSLPLFDRFRVPARFLLPFTFFAALLAARALDELQSRLRARRASVALVAIALSATLVDLLLFNLPFSSTFNSETPVAEILAAPPVLRAITDPAARFYTNVYTPNLRPNRTMILNRASAQVYSPLVFERFEKYAGAMSPAMANLLNVRYIVQHSGELAPEYADQNWNPASDFFQGEFRPPSLLVKSVEIVSFTQNTENLEDGAFAGEITLTFLNRNPVVIPIRLGTDTADWAHAANRAAHSQPRAAQRFAAFLPGVGDFDGFKYTARFDLATPLILTAIQARATLPRGKWFVESITLYDSSNQPYSLATMLDRAETRVVFKSHTATLYENASVLPRVLVFHRAEVLPDDQILTRLNAPGFTADRVLLLSEGTPIAQEDAPRGAAEIVEYRAERVVVRVNSPRAGYLFLADSWYPGWIVQLTPIPLPPSPSPDVSQERGQGGEVLRADYIFRAVPIDAGAHEVVFEFRPTSFYVGALISGVSLTLASVLLLLSWKTRS